MNALNRPFDEVALFGTCGANTTWRQPFISELRKRGIDYYDPSLFPFFDPMPRELLIKRYEQELFKLDVAERVLRTFVITDETAGKISLGELSHVLHIHEDSRPLIAYVAPTPSRHISERDAAVSKRFRDQVRAHLDEFKGSENVHTVDSVDEALSTTLTLCSPPAENVQ